MQFLSYLFFVFGLSQLTLIVQNYWQFSSQIGNFVWIQNLLSLLFSGVMIWILVKTGHGYLFRISKKKMALVFDFDSISGSAPDLFLTFRQLNMFSQLLKVGLY